MDKMNLSVVSVFKMFCSVFSHIRAEYGEIQGISPYSLRMRENTDTFQAVNTFEEEESKE